MNTREKFLAIAEFGSIVSPPLYEMGYWAGTIRRWYQEGLVKIEGISESLSSGDCVIGPLLGGEENERCNDLDRFMKFDKRTEKIFVENWIFPKFKPRVIKKFDDRMVVIDEMGIQKKVSCEDDSIPEYYEWPVKNKDDWEKIKYERLNPKTPGRYPSNLKQMIRELKSRDYPLVIGGLPVGFFGSLRYLMGEVTLFTSFYDNPELVKEMINYLVEFWIELWTPILLRLNIDWVNIWEDMCYKTAPLISPDTFREFILPAYKKFTAFLRSMGIKKIIVDTDGNCWKLIPLFIEGGVTGLLPMEVAAGMEVVKVRKEFPKLLIIGGIDKRSLIKGKHYIDAELESKIPYMLKKGGYIPCVDHLVPPDVSFDNFRYYRYQLERLINAHLRKKGVCKCKCKVDPIVKTRICHI